MICKVCDKAFKYNPQEYGGYSEDFKGNTCKSCRVELMEIKSRYNQELKEWVGTKKETIK